MSVEELFQKAMQRAAGSRGNGFDRIGLGTAIDVTDNSCSVEIEGAPTLHEVRFHSVVDDLESSVTIIPKTGSYVLYGTVAGQPTEAVIIKCSEIERVTVTIDTTKHEITSSGHEISREGNNLRGAIVDFISEVQKIIVINGTSPDVAALEQIKDTFKSILK